MHKLMDCAIATIALVFQKVKKILRVVCIYYDAGVHSRIEENTKIVSRVIYTIEVS